MYTNCLAICQKKCHMFTKELICNCHICKLFQFFFPYILFEEMTNRGSLATMNLHWIYELFACFHEISGNMNWLLHIRGGKGSANMNWLLYD